MGTFWEDTNSIILHMGTFEKVQYKSILYIGTFEKVLSRYLQFEDQDDIDSILVNLKANDNDLTYLGTYMFFPSLFLYLFVIILISKGWLMRILCSLLLRMINFQMLANGLCST